jgi:predicted nucleic acid-binding protein
MSRNLIDTNLIIRFLVNDDPKKVLKVEKLLKDKSNQNILLDTVVAEIIWVLGSYYSLKKQSVIEKIRALIHVDTIECSDFLINRALTIWEESKLSYIDAYLASIAELGNFQLFSYDTQFKSIPSIKAKEP